MELEDMKQINIPHSLYVKLSNTARAYESVYGEPFTISDLIALWSQSLEEAGGI